MDRQKAYERGTVKHALFIVLLLAGIVAADPQSDQAYQRLKEKQAAKAAAATQPARITNAELESLQKELADLKRKLVAMTAEIQSLQQQNERLKNDANVAAAPKPAGGADAKAIAAAMREGRFIVGMTIAQVRAVAHKESMAFDTAPTSTDTLVGDKTIHREKWRLVGTHGWVLYFENDILVEAQMN